MAQALLPVLLVFSLHLKLSGFALGTKNKAREKIANQDEQNYGGSHL